jgi:hypothetical protein
MAEAGAAQDERRAQEIGILLASAHRLTDEVARRVTHLVDKLAIVC